MLKAIFYARFHPERGPSVIHQYPAHSVIAPSGSSDETLLNFSAISSYVIPPYEICNGAVSICTNGFRVLGFPVSLEDAKYARNRFTFNVCFILDEKAEPTPWEQVVQKTARFFQEIEEEDGLLQAEELFEGLKWAGEEGYPVFDVGVVHTLLEATFEELNAYGETCVRLNELHVLNLRLVSQKSLPSTVKAWDVPLLIRPLPTSAEWTWDLTLQRIHHYIDGVKHVQRIAELADVELRLVKKAVRELLYHEQAMILDLFHFQAIYAPTDDFYWFVKDTEMQEECCTYVATDPTNNIFHSKAVSTAQPAAETIVLLYRQLNPGTTLQEFCLTHESDLVNIDIRRLITFGVIKGFLRRIHRFALTIDTQSTPPQLKSANGSVPGRARSSETSALEFERAWKKAALSSGWPTPPMEPLVEGMIGDATAQSENDEKLRKFLDGKHCMDEICVSVQMSEKKVMDRLRSGRFGEVVILCK